MAKTVFSVEEVILQDESTITLKPLTIKDLRKFMKIMKESEKKENPTEDDFLEVLFRASALCLRKERPDFWNNEEETYTEAYEDVMDIPTMHRVLKICGGVDLQDPNLLALAEKVGTTST